MRHQQGQGIIISHIFRQIVFLMPPCCQIIALVTLRHLKFKFQMLINEILIFSFALTIRLVEKLMLLFKGLPFPLFIPEPSRHMLNAFFGIVKAKAQLSLTSNPSLGPRH